MLPSILVTGASGFIGRRLTSALRSSGRLNPIGVVRTAAKASAGIRCYRVPDINSKLDWSDCLTGIDSVIHCCARVHVMDEAVSDPLAEFRKTNVEATLNLARQSAIAGVRRFVFISSIKVNGEWTYPNDCFTAEDDPLPLDPYGISKYEAEQALFRLASETGMEVVVIRPPLVYGPGVKGNFARLVELVNKGLPLPLGSVYNKRSLVGLDNLVDLIITCVEHPSAANQIFLASDGRDLSTTELLKALAIAGGKRGWLVPIPVIVLEAGAAVLGKRAIARRLLDSLQVDISKNRELLGWEPPISVEEGLRRCFVDYKGE